MNISGNAVLKAVDTTESTVRRTIGSGKYTTLVDLDNCTTCHERVGFHSNAGRMGSPEYCSVCHNPEMSSSNLFTGFATFPGADNEEFFYRQQPNNFKELIHSIHAAPIRDESDPYNFIRANPFQTTGGSGPMVFQDVPYPMQPADCTACHKPGTYGLPDNARYGWSVVDASPALVAPANAASFNPALTYRQGPGAGACGSCHNSSSSKAHFAVNTSTATAGESCGTCHGAGKAYEAHK
jgi:OmcA/MtrC family decaheme c-type cytochrome